MNEVSYIAGARREAVKAQGQARPESVRIGSPALLRRGKVTAVTGDTYSVAVLGADGTPGEVYTRVDCIPEGTLVVDDIVWLVFEQAVGPAHPMILNSAGGASGYYYAEAGFLTD